MSPSAKQIYWLSGCWGFSYGCYSGHVLHDAVDTTVCFVGNMLQLPASEQLNCNMRCSIHCRAESVTKHWHMLPEHHQDNYCPNQTCILCCLCNCWSTDAKICLLQLHFASNTERLNRKQTAAFANNWTSAICGRFVYWKLT